VRHVQVAQRSEPLSRMAHASTTWLFAHSRS
jgi:hypothetical protein